MNNFNNAQSSIANLSQAQIDEGLRSHMLRVYNYMSAALALTCLLYTSPSPRDATLSRMPSSA